MINKPKKKWNRTHMFVKEDKSKSNYKNDPKEHPGYVFEQSKTHYKTITFTHHPTTNGISNRKLKHNIDPSDAGDCYGVRYTAPRPKSDFKPADKPYRIHKDDFPIIKELKSSGSSSRKAKKK